MGVYLKAKEAKAAHKICIAGILERIADDRSTNRVVIVNTDFIVIDPLATTGC